jgi:putative oxidoreductase
MSSLLRLADSAYSWFVKAANWLQSPLLLLIRVYWGWQFWQSGVGKLHDISKVVDYFTTLGIPFPALNAHFVALLEAGGGILLLLGLGSRLIALPLVIDMVVAYVTADREALGSIISDPAKFYNADPFTYLFSCLIILAFGPGLFSLDTIIRWYRNKRQPAAAAKPS